MDLASQDVIAIAPRMGNKRLPFTARLLALWPEWITLALYATLLGFCIPYHEPWADEAQAWQLARSLSLHDLFHTYIRYEGTPGLWHFVLWTLARLHVTYAGMHWFSGGIAVAGVAVLLLYAPFPRYLKLLLPFTYFLAFQYAVVARGYVLVPLLLFAIAALWKKSPVVVAVLLGLLGNVALHALAISGGLAIVYFIERRRARGLGQPASGSPRDFAAATFLLAAFYAFAVWTVLPPEDFGFGRTAATAGGHGVPFIGGWGLGIYRLIFSPLFGVTEPALFAIPLWVAIVYAMHKRRQIFYLIPIATFALFSIVYLMFWHAGLIVPLTIAVLWIAGVEIPKLRWPRTSDATAFLACFVYFFAVQIGWTAHAVLYDHYHDYSPDRAAAMFLKPYVQRGDGIAVSYFENQGAEAAHATGILPYFSHQIYLNQEKPFWWWSTRNPTDANFDRALSEKPPIVLVEYSDMTGQHPFNPALALTDPKVRRISIAGYRISHVFCGEQPIRFTYETRICHVIFQRDTGAAGMEKPHP